MRCRGSFFRMRRIALGGRGFSWHLSGSRRSCLLVLSGVLLMLCDSQSGKAQNSERDGLSVSGISLSETFFTQGVPAGITTYGDVFLGSAVSVSAAANVTWNRTRAKSFMNLWLVPVYGGRFG